MIHAPSDTQRAAANPRLAILRREVEQTVLKPFQSHSWRATVEREIDHDDCIEIVAEKGPVTVRIAILYSSSGISNAKYRALEHELIIYSFTASHMNWTASRMA